MSRDVGLRANDMNEAGGKGFFWRSTGRFMSIDEEGSMNPEVPLYT